MITMNDLIQRFGEDELFERGEQDAIEKAMNDAIAEAQSYVKLSGVVLVQPSVALVGFVCDMARYRLYDDAVTQIIEDRYKRAVAWLKEAVKNPQMLDDTLSGSLNDSPYVGCAVMSNQPLKWSDFGE